MEGGFNLPLILIRIICNHPHNPMNHFSICQLLFYKFEPLLLISR